MLGSHCWLRVGASGAVTTLCADTALLDPPNPIPVAVGESLIVNINAHEKPLVLTAFIVGRSESFPSRSITFEPSLVSSFVADLPIGLYNLYVSGQWLEGDVYYAFKIEVK